ncbi:MAG: Uma2 family endonuclease [Treponema sp.]|jgi:Uma2 family endonuclease|nr:Uma2 family endonuclease [Treponema sp.]
MSDASRIDEIEESTYTYADYLEWNDGKRYEIIDGIAYMMAAPAPNHQRISMELSRQFSNFLLGKPCRVFAAPLDVRLFPQKDLTDDTVVQPDLLVVCDKTKLDKRGCNGAPDLVIEILSPSNDAEEMLRKFQKYLQAGVREYWVVDLDNHLIQVHIFDKGHYISSVYDGNALVPVSILLELRIDLNALWGVLE